MSTDTWALQGGSRGGQPNCAGVPAVRAVLPRLQGFMIGEYALDFKINLNITTTTAAASAADANSTAAGNSTLGGGNSTGSSRTEVLAITPAQPFQRDSGRRVSAKLLGDLEAYQQAPQLDGKYLMIPTPAGRSRCLPT